MRGQGTNAVHIIQPAGGQQEGDECRGIHDKENSVHRGPEVILYTWGDEVSPEIPGSSLL
jgi:hypothetical protein